MAIVLFMIKTFGSSLENYRQSPERNFSGRQTEREEEGEQCGEEQARVR